MAKMTVMWRGGGQWTWRAWHECGRDVLHACGTVRTFSRQRLPVATVTGAHFATVPRRPASPHGAGCPALLLVAFYVSLRADTALARLTTCAAASYLLPALLWFYHPIPDPTTPWTYQFTHSRTFLVAAHRDAAYRFYSTPWILLVRPTYLFCLPPTFETLHYPGSTTVTCQHCRAACIQFGTDSSVTPHALRTSFVLVYRHAAF